MKIVLVGHPNSQRIVPASKYLTGKYLPMFDITYLNYEGEINGWSEYVAGFLRYLTDDHVIFALDDYLISDYMDVEQYEKAESKIGGDVVCVKLCLSTEEEHKEYPITTQYCIWDRSYLIWLLEQVQTPWQFELAGSSIFNEGNKRSLHYPCIFYDAHSALSGRWKGINWNRIKDIDKNEIESNGLL